MPPPIRPGDRVVYRDPEDPRFPLAGEVVEVTDHAVAIRYDDQAGLGLVSTQHAPDVLRAEADDHGPTRLRPGYWCGESP